MTSDIAALPNSPFNGLHWGFVYLLRLGDKYKIGRTGNLRTRVKAINRELAQRHKPPVSVEHYFTASYGQVREQQFHDYFVDKRTASETGANTYWPTRKRKREPCVEISEWYCLSPEEVEYIKSFTNEV